MLVLEHAVALHGCVEGGVDGIEEGEGHVGLEGGEEDGAARDVAAEHLGPRVGGEALDDVLRDERVEEGAVLLRGELRGLAHGVLVAAALVPAHADGGGGERSLPAQDGRRPDEEHERGRPQEGAGSDGDGGEGAGRGRRRGRPVVAGSAGIEGAAGAGGEADVVHVPRAAEAAGGHAAVDAVRCPAQYEPAHVGHDRRPDRGVDRSIGNDGQQSRHDEDGRRRAVRPRQAELGDELDGFDGRDRGGDAVRPLPIEFRGEGDEAESPNAETDAHVAEERIRKSERADDKGDRFLRDDGRREVGGLSEASERGAECGRATDFEGEGCVRPVDQDYVVHPMDRHDVAGMPRCDARVEVVVRDEERRHWDVDVGRGKWRSDAV